MYGVENLASKRNPPQIPTNDCPAIRHDTKAFPIWQKPTIGSIHSLAETNHGEACDVDLPTLKPNQYRTLRTMTQDTTSWVLINEPGAAR